MPEIRVSEGLRPALFGRRRVQAPDARTLYELFADLQQRFPEFLEITRPFESSNVYVDGVRTSHSEEPIGARTRVSVLADIEDKPREEHLRRLVQESADPQAMMQLGHLFELRGDEPSAIESFERAAAIGAVRAWRELGLLHERAGRFGEAERAYLLATDGGDAIALRYLGQMWLRDGRREDGHAVLRDAAAGGDTIALRLLGESLASTGDAEAIQVLTEAGFHRGDNPALRLLADLLWREGDLAASQAALQTAASRGDKRASADLDSLRRQDLSTSPLPAPQSAVAPARGPDTNIVARVSSDLPTEVDELGVTPLVLGLAHLLNDRSTQLPLAIAITGPWGSGKSSVMRQLERALGQSSVGERRWRTVRFDAWKYERRERLWAALATAIYQAPQQDRSAFARIAFRTRLEWYRRGPFDFLRSVVWPIPAGLLALAAAIAADAPGETAMGIGLSTAVAFVGTATRYAGVVGDPFKRALERYSSGPDYKGHLGFTQEAEDDIKCLLRAAMDKSHNAVAVFVDDLDRCSSEHVVEVVETMNQMFNAEDGRQTLFVLGMDREVVAASIEVAYAETVARLEAAGSPLAGSFGMEFLSKLVQLSIKLPPPSSAAMQRLLGTLSPRALPPSIGDDEDLDVDVEILADDLRERSSDLADLGRASEELRATGVPDDRVEEARVTVGRERIREDSTDVRNAEAAVVSCLLANPRQLKRFDNAFRLQLHVANESGALDFSSDGLVALARWVAVRLRWPHLAEALDKHPDLLESLERRANGEEPPDQEGPDAAVATWFENRSLLDVLTSERSDARASGVASEGFLRVT